MYRYYIWFFYIYLQVFLQLTHGQTEAKAEDGLPSVSETVSDNISIDSLSLDDSDSSTSFSDRISEFTVFFFVVVVVGLFVFVKQLPSSSFCKKKKKAAKLIPLTKKQRNKETLIKNSTYYNVKTWKIK